MEASNSFYLSETEKRWCVNNNVSLTYPGQNNYPKAFFDLPVRPSFLFYMGPPLWRTHRLLSVVGSRNPHSSSLAWLESNLCRVLEHKDIVVVSGGARGVDQKAHQVAVRMGRPTLAFLPSGLMNIYPNNFEEWVTPILESGGGLVSQFLPSAQMRKRFFRERNRLIAGIAPMTLIVECKRRSGTSLTAKCALELGRSLGVMPTSPGENGMGGLDLLADGPSFLVRDYRDIVEKFP